MTPPGKWRAADPDGIVHSRELLLNTVGGQSAPLYFVLEVLKKAA
jgi:hypothetical protein